jgi:hypothetical protein
MFNTSKVLTAATGLVGFRQDSNAIYALLPTSLKTITSGFYINDLPGVTFEMVAAALPDDATNAQTYLTNAYNAEVLSIVTQYVESVKNKLGAQELLTNQNFTSGVGKFSDRVTQNARFVGYLIKPKESNNIQATLTAIGMQVTATQATPLKIYLYETSQNEAIKTYDFTSTKELSLEWKTVSDFIINYQSDTGGTGQMFYLGYYEKDPNNPQAFQLQSQALKAQFDCGCSGSPKLMWSKYLGIYPIEINNEDLDWDGTKYLIPKPDDIWNNVTDQTYGMTAKVNVKCDLTNLIVSNIAMFAKAIQHAVAVRILFDAYATTRINSISDSKRDQSREFGSHYKNILNGYTTPEGVKVKGILDLLAMDFTGLDKYCAPCNPKEVTFGRLIR